MAAADASMRTVSSTMRLLVALLLGFNVLVEAHGHHGYASSSLLVDMCNWCGCAKHHTLRRRHGWYPQPWYVVAPSIKIRPCKGELSWFY